MFKEEIQGRDVNRLNVTWSIEEDNLMRGFNGVFAHLINKDTNQDRIDKWGSYEFENEKANVDFYLTEYMPSGNYGVPYINIVDEAGNSSPYYFSDSELDEKMKTVEIISSNPDTKAPEIDVNKIYVKATPTKPEAPDGETLVEITYYARDDKSGLGEVSYILRDPQGIGHREYHYHENFGTLFFEGDPTAWKEYKISVVLPRGSAPGIWGLEEINIIDKARNRKNYNFTENIHFEVGTQAKSISNYGLQVGLGNNTALQEEEIILPIYINNIPEGGVNNLNIAIEYDKKSLELIEVTKGELIYQNDDLKYNLADDKKIYLTFNDASQGERTLYSSGNIAYLKFKVDENAKRGEQIITFYKDSLRVQDAANVRLEKLEIENYEGKVDIQGYAKADIDCNNSIDIADLAKVALKYNKDNNSEQWDNKLDFNDDKIIDIFDLIYVSKNI